VPGINSGANDTLAPLPPLYTLEEEVVLALMQKVEAAYSAYMDKYPIVSRVLCHKTAYKFYPSKYAQ
jgi:hypothetical protein